MSVEHDRPALAFLIRGVLLCMNPHDSRLSRRLTPHAALCSTYVSVTKSVLDLRTQHVRVQVGEEVPLARVLDESGGSDWKGRREELIKLREQVWRCQAASCTKVSGIDVGLLYAWLCFQLAIALPPGTNAAQLAWALPPKATSWQGVHIQATYPSGPA